MRASTRFFASIVVLFFIAPVFAEDGKSRSDNSLIWQERGVINTLNLLEGPGGRDRQPGESFRFIKESTAGTSPKFEVVDEKGVTWKAKLGPETKSETAATRLMWAMGYFVDEDYYRGEIKVEGMKPLRRGQKYVSANGVVTGVRLERQYGSEAGTGKGKDKGEGGDSENWSWYDNPFIGTREFNGLRVMMALINNWDLKAVNNAISIGDDGKARYVVADLGATFGRTGAPLNRSKGVAKDYAENKFVDKVRPEYVNFVMHTRPFILTIFNLKYYKSRSRMENVTKHVPPADARWIGDRLAQLRTEQIRDCFRSAGFSTAEVEVYAKVLSERIAALEGLDLNHIARVAQ